MEIVQPTGQTARHLAECVVQFLGHETHVLLGIRDVRFVVAVVQLVESRAAV